MNRSVVELTSVRKTFGQKVALDAITTQIPQGAICGIIGPNGSGKTTLLRIILDILRPDSGKVRVLGNRRPRLANNAVSYLPEERGLYKKMRVWDQLAYLGQLKGVEKRLLPARVGRWLERMGLEGIQSRRVEALSKGMAQKIQFIGTLINDPLLLILDEPFSGLDPVNLELIRDIVLERKAMGTTILFSTHDMAMAEKLCDSILMIYEGVKVLDGSLNSIQGNYGADTVRLRVRPRPGAELQALFTEDGGAVTVRDLGRFQEIRGLRDPHQFLKGLLDRFHVDYFEIAPPNLHDIFVRIARPEKEEAEETGGRANAYL